MICQCGAGQPQQHLDGGGFAGAVRPQEAENLAPPNLQGQVGHGDRFAELFADELARRRSTLIFHGIVQQGSDGLVFVGSEFKCDSGDTQKVRDIGNLGSLAFLAGVEACCKQQRSLESFRHVHGSI